MEEKQSAQVKSDLTQEVPLSEIQKPSTVVKKRKPSWIIGVIILAIIVAGYFLISQSRQKAAENKIYHVGILSGLNNSIIIGDIFKQEMTKLGYIEGENIFYDYQKTNFQPDKDMQILEKFVADKVDLIFGFNTEVGLEAKTAVKGTDIPVLFAMGIIEGNDLVKSISEPGGNITGVRYPGVDFAVKRFEVLHQIVPKAKRFWIPYQKDYPTAKFELEAVRKVAASSNVSLIEFPAKDLTDLQAELERRSKLADIGFDAVLYIPESISTTKEAFEIISKFTRERKVPVGGTKMVIDDYGTLFGVSVFYPDQGKLAANLAGKILKGIPAGAIPVVSPESYLIINYKVAQELGLTMPESLMIQAGEIIR
jgi:putative tryptophan/tyrosine transport system substrate-binding protein